jgi:hypothetical protein
MKRGGTAFTHTIPPAKTWIHMEKPLMTAAAVPAVTVPPRAIRNIALALTLTLVVATSIANPSLAQGQASSPATTGVMVIVTVKAGVTPEQVMATMHAEIQQTVQLYLNGKIREWYSRSDGRGVVLLLDTKDVAEAHAIMDGLPLGKQNIVDHEFIAVGPLMPLRMLTAKP